MPRKGRWFIDAASLHLLCLDSACVQPGGGTGRKLVLERREHERESENVVLPLLPARPRQWLCPSACHLTSYWATLLLWSQLFVLVRFRHRPRFATPGKAEGMTFCSDWVWVLHHLCFSSFNLDLITANSPLVTFLTFLKITSLSITIGSLQELESCVDPEDNFQNVPDYRFFFFLVVAGTFYRMKKKNHTNVKKWIRVFLFWKAFPYWRLVLDYLVSVFAHLFLPSNGAML